MSYSKSVDSITSEKAMRLVEEYHYSNRRVGSKFSFGLFIDGELCGCCVFSIPASYTLCRGVCGIEYSSQVLELSRLVVTTDEKNAASFLIASSLKQIGNWIVVSYADCNSHVGHVGYVYQATNWIYTGKGTAEPKWINASTGEVVSYTRRHIDVKAKAIGMDWRDLQQEKQAGKHRYVTFCGDRRFRTTARKSLKYRPEPYPKGDTCRHAKRLSQGVLF